METYPVMLHKKSILEINNVYTANAFHSSGISYVGAGSETDPTVKLYNLTNDLVESVDGCPGGLMSFIPVPGQENLYVTIQGLFPPFIGEEAGLFLHQFVHQEWKTTKALELPFAHRCEILSHQGTNHLVAATVSKNKENPADWTRPGELYLISLNNPSGVPWLPQLVDAGITRNHGMTRTIIDGEESICISGAEGIFRIAPVINGDWRVESIFSREVSEMTFIDLDGDGTNELITIEPFHGNSLNVYKKIDHDWKLLFTDSLSFGHGLSSGFFNGKPLLVVGNRSDSLALEIFTTNNLLKGAVKREVIDENTGPTQTQIFSHQSVDYILSANQRKNEVAIYWGSFD